MAKDNGTNSTKRRSLRELLPEVQVHEESHPIFSRPIALGFVNLTGKSIEHFRAASEESAPTLPKRSS